MSTPVSVDLVDPQGARTGALVVSGFTQPGHGRVTLLGSRAIYTPTPGYSGGDSFRYTVSDPAGQSSTALVALDVAAAAPVCTITISGPPSAIRGPAIQLAAVASCDIGTPEIQWQHRTGTSGTFSTFKNFSTATSAEFSTTFSSLGNHQFRARVRSQGTTTVFTSNTATTVLVASTAPCTAVVLDLPASGAVFATGQPISLSGTATCPAGAVAEYQYWVKAQGAASYTVLPGYFSGASSYTPPLAGTWLFVAAARAVGSSDAFQVQSTPVTVAVSHAPSAVDDNLAVVEDHTGTVNVLANDSDPDGDALTATITTAPVGGTATIAAGVVTYRPATNYYGSDTIGYTVNDGHGNTATAAVHVSVAADEDPPSAHHDFVTVAGGTGVSLDPTANDTDIDGDPMTVIALSSPAHGTATRIGNIVTYTPNPSYVGSDTFEYTITDGHGENSVAGVFVTVTAGNAAPQANDDDLSTPEDTSGTVGLLANDTDDGGSLTVVSFTQPAHGLATVTAGVATYAPVHDYNGPDSFTYTVKDASNAQSTATVHVTVAPVNDAPTAAPEPTTTDEDDGVTIDVVANDSDVDLDPLTVTAVTQPAHGTAAITSGHEVTYTPAADYNGPDAFSYTISDGHGGTASAAVTVAVTAVNDPPSAASDTPSVAEDTTVTLAPLANDSDIDLDPLTITAITQPAHGVAVLVDATHVSYTPAANYHGADAFSYTISDGHGGEAGAAISVTVTPVNDAPTAGPDTATTDEDVAVTIAPLGNDGDIDLDALTIAAVTQPAHGVAAVVDATHVAYTPAANYAGQDAFSYTISDGHGGEATAAIAVTVNPVNDAPGAVADTASVAEDTSAVIDVVANDNDLDLDTLAIAAVTQPAHGAVVIVDAHRVSYTPAANYHGPDGFSYTITDPPGAQATALVVVDVTPVNDAPIASADSASLDEDTAVTVDVVANDFDVDVEPLTITAITQPAHGLALLLDDHRVRYVPAPNYHGSDALNYTISDGHGGTASATLTLDVASVNDAPIANVDATSLDEDTAAALDVVANDSDVDLDPLAIASLTQPAHGTAAITGLHTVSYVPAPNYHGADSFQYTISDGHGGQATAGVTLDVISINDAPSAAPDAAGLDEDTGVTIDVAANDTDVDLDPLTVASVTQPAHGVAAIVDGHRVSYVPAADHSGTDSFQYTISDGHGGQATATVSLTIAPLNDAPIASAGVVNTFDDTPAVAVLSATDADSDPLVFAIGASPAHGSLGPVVGNHVTYTPAPGYAGPDTFTFTAYDGHVTSAAAAVVVTVVRSVCGNGAREGVHEECDDGNAAPSDGCESTCRLTCGSGTGADRASVDLASGHCFAAFDGVQHSYQDAAAMCSAVGGHLPTITSAGEDTAALAAVHASDAPWLGADDIAIEGAFGWVTGESFAGYNNFAAGKPDNAGGADCVRYLADGTWSDVPCSGPATGVSGTLCEFELAVATPAVATGGAGTRSVAIADLNGDTYADLAVVNQTANSVGVLLGDGAGGFTLAGTYATGSGPIAIAAGDFDLDGDADLAIANATANTLTVLRNNGAGGFTVVGTPLAIAAGATALAAGDLDGDNVIDLAVTAAGLLGTGTVQVLHGNGSGGFAVSGSIALTVVAAGIAIGDFNLDGKKDLVLTTPVAVLVVMGTGGGGFGLPLSLAVSLNNRGVVVADLDGDGNLDLAVANGNSTITTNPISVWFGSPSGTFGGLISLPVAGIPLSVLSGDFDGDGGKDLIALTSGSATLFHGTGRTFAQAGVPMATGGAGAVLAAAGYLNADATADVVIANATSSTAGILLGGTGGLAGARAVPVGVPTATASSTASGDFNEDGRADLAIVDTNTSKVYIYLQNSAGALVASGSFTTPVNGGPNYPLVADFTNDNHADILVVNTAFGSVSVLVGNGVGGFGPPQNTTTGTGPRRPAIFDLTGDNLPDLAVPIASNNIVILSNTGFGRFAKLSTEYAGGNNPTAAVAGDFNGDGKKDLAVIDAGEASVKLLLGTGVSPTLFSTAASFTVPSGGQAIGAGDFDGDTKLDLVATATTTNSVSYLRGTGTGSFDAPVSIPAGSQPAAIAVADFDGDYRLDVVVGNAGSSDATVLHNNGAASFVATSYAIGAALTWVCVADLDRDGHPDLAAATGGPFATLLYSGR